MKTAKILTILVLASAIMVWTAEVSEAVEMGTAFTYQGHLYDNNDVANGLYDFRFSLYDVNVGGAAVANDVNVHDMDVIDGYFRVELDFGEVFNGDARWLQIGVRPGDSSGSFTTLSPRQELTPTPYALALPGLWTEQNATSTNIIGGYSGNSVTAGVVAATIGGGGDSTWPNKVTDDYCTVGGGRRNQAGDDAGTTSDSPYATVGGGWYNAASDYYATVGGGYWNTASGQWATVGGGRGNTAIQYYATVSGGMNNTASEWYATIGGGLSNTASGIRSTVGGGSGNTASGWWATVAGGSSNIAGGYYSFAAGRRAKVRDAAASGDVDGDEGTFIWADSTNANFQSTGPDQFLIRASGGVGIGTTSPQGTLDVNGPIYQSGGVLHADYVFEPDYELESIDEHSEFMWQQKHLPAIPKAKVNDAGQEIVEVGAHRKGIVEELEKAHIYIEQLYKENQEIKKQLAEMQNILSQLVVQQKGRL